MRILYTLGIIIYYLLLKLASIFNPKAKLWIEGRKNIYKDINGCNSPIWIHCASLGEYEQGLPIRNAIKQKFPNKAILITFFSPSGYEIIKQKNKEDFISYLPLDTTLQMSKFIETVQPEMAIFVKYEYWYNALQLLYKKEIPVYFVSAIFRKKQLFFTNYGSWFREHLTYVNHFFVQDKNSFDLLQSIQIKNVTISGDTRYDRVKEILKRDNTLTEIEKFKGNSALIVAGSTWKEDDEMIVNYLNESEYENVKFIIVPHEIHPKYFKTLKESIRKESMFFSEILHSDNPNLNFQVLIVDSIGFLTKIYSYATVAYVGGGFGKEGIHNILEPAVFGIPILIGPIFHQFLEAEELIKNSGTISIINGQDFTEKLNYFLSNPLISIELGNRNKETILLKPNAVESIISTIF